MVARGERWIVRAVVAHEDCAELHLTSAAEPRGRVLLWPFDRPVARTGVRQLRVIKPRHWWPRVAWLFTAARVDGLGARPAGARVLPYQLVPALAAATGTSGLILADEVGLGKTIQAGWIISDLVQRQPGARVLVAVPAGLRHQWQSELSRHFGVDSIATDAAWLRRTFADLPADVNPWSLPGVYVTSIDFVKRADVLRSLEEQVWDALIVDEAHTAAAPTDRHVSLSRIASHTRLIVLITATPFSGDEAAFASLVSLATTVGEPPMMFRRSREEEGVSRPRRHRFAAVRISDGERRLQRLLERYTREVWTSAGDEGARLAMTVLRKRALSSPGAVARSLDRRRALLQSEPQAPRQLKLFDEELAVEDEEPAATLGVRGLADERREHRWLARLAAAARAAPDSKRTYLSRLLRRLHGEAAIVFTEYRDTLHDLSASFPGCLILHGGMSTAERADVQARFNQDGGLLFATDAASEGLNLQQRCRVVICYELPWNPARLEQRIGRVDRIGQSRRVHANTLVARDTAEDLVIARLVRRLTRVAATLGERDRLAGFLTDARTAGIVIGGASSEPVETAWLRNVTPGSSDQIRPGPSTTHKAIDEAQRLACRVTKPFTSREDAVLVSAIRATRNLSPGFVFVFRWSGVTGDGTVIDCRPALVHVPADVTRPRRAAEARDTASEAIRKYGRTALERVSSAGAVRVEHVREVHDATTERAVARELELRDRDGARTEVQPGLFDTRAVAAATQQSTARQQVRADHDQRIAALRAAKHVEPRWDLAAVLIVHGA